MAERIKTAEDEFGPDLARFLRVQIPMFTGRPAPAIPGTLTAAAVQAKVNHGRWLARCPDCAGAELVAPVRPFLCLSYVEQGHPPVWRPVVFPAEMENIEAVLTVRPMPNRNWEPEESVAELERENAEHSLPARRPA